MDSREVTVDLFCRVVDNYGDIGVVWRLARHLKAARPQWRIRLTVSDLEVFRCLEPRIDPQQRVQTWDGLEILPWDEENFPSEGPIQVAVENFAGGWPGTYGNQLMDPSDTRPRLAVNVDYLTAEDYAREYHRLPSLTPLAQVKKFFFMPGFTDGTGGLLLGSDYRPLADPAQEAECTGARLEWLQTLGQAEYIPMAGRFWVSLFTYEHDFRPLVSDLQKWDRPILLILPRGRGEQGFLMAWEAAGKPFPVLRIPFLPQGDYDRLVGLSDFNIVRGEESLVRACVSARPFLWHAYLQEEGYHRVKVEALLARMKPHFPHPEDWVAVENLFLEFNHRYLDTAEHPATESFSPLLTRWNLVKEGFRSFADQLWAQGDLGKNLAVFIEETLTAP